MKLLFIFVSVCFTSSVAAQEKNKDMVWYRFEQSPKSKWSGKKNPTGIATYSDDWKERTWTGTFTNGHLNGQFSMFNKNGVLLLEGVANMDTIVEATQYAEHQYVTRTTETTIGLKATRVSVPVYSGKWKNGGWYTGRWFRRVWSEYNKMPKPLEYVDGVFDENGFPVGEIEEFKSSREAPDTFNLYYRGKLKNGSHDGPGKYFYYDGALSKTGVSVDGHDIGIWKFYWREGNTAHILYEEAMGDFTSGFITGWKHTQFEDGHCTKTLYDQNSKPVKGYEWNFPAAKSGIRPDSVNFETIKWEGKLYSGAVVNGKPNGWGKTYASNSTAFQEGFFKDGVLTGGSALVDYSKTGSRSYFALYRDGKLNTDVKIFDPYGDEARIRAAEDAKKPPTDPVNLLTRGDVVKINGTKYTVVDNPWNEKDIIKSFRGWVTLSDGSFLKAGTPFEKLNEKVTVFDYKTCITCSGTGTVVSYTETHVLISPALYSSYERVRGNRVEEVSVLAQPAVYETKRIAHYKPCWVCDGTGKLKK